MRTLTILFALCAPALACGAADSSTTTSKGGPSGQGGQAEAREGRSTADLDIVFNEVAAVGATEWIEIANKGPSAVDIGGYFIADSDKQTKEPKKGAIEFPTGTKLEPGERLLILTSKKQAAVGPHPKVECLPDGPETCFFAEFGVSATNGEPLHLLAEDGSVVTSTAIPKTPGADAGGVATESECRLPDFTGEFAKCAPTPGHANRAQ